MADRLAATRGEAQRAHRRRERFSTLGIGVGLLVVGAATVLLLVGVVGWLMGTPVNLGEAAGGGPVYSCETGDQTGLIFSGDTVQVIGPSNDGAWMVILDPDGGSARMFVAADLVTMEDPVGGAADCDALDSPGETTSTSEALLAAPTTKGPRHQRTTTTLFGTASTAPGTGPTGPTGPSPTIPPPSNPGLTTTTTSPGSPTTTTGSNPTTTQPHGTTTTTKATTTTTKAPITTTTTNPTTTTTGATTTTTTVATTTTTDPTTTTTEDPGSTTLP